MKCLYGLRTGVHPNPMEVEILASRQDEMEMEPKQGHGKYIYFSLIRKAWGESPVWHQWEDCGLREETLFTEALKQ